jgi:hypothetical protein
MAATVEQEITPTGEMTESPELQTALEGATTAEEIRAIVLQEAAKQGFTVPGDTRPRDAEGRFASPETKETPKVETKSEGTAEEAKFAYVDEFVIGGKKYTFEGDSPAEINRQVKAAIAAHENATNPPKKEEPGTAGPKQITADQKIALELDFKMGKIGLDEYLEKTGALDAYLEKKGVKVEQLRDVVNEKVSKKANDAWESATKEFIAAHKDEWHGGQQNGEILGYLIADLGLQNKPSLDSLNQAFEVMKTKNLIFPVEPKAEVKTEPAPQPKKKLGGSSVFGLVGGAGRDRAPNTGAAKVPEITPDMSAREIMELYKTTALANGQHPDQLLVESQRR